MSDETGASRRGAPLAEALCATVNTALRLDEEAADILAPLDGTHLAFAVNGITEVHVGFAEGRMRALTASLERTPDLRISGSAGEFMSVGLEMARQLPEQAARGGTPELPPGLRFEGDLGVAQRLVKALTRLRPDFEAPLAAMFGEVGGHHVARALGGAAKGASGAAKQFAEDVAEYLREEAEVTVGRADIDDLADAVDELRDAAARLEARISRLVRVPPGGGSGSS